MKERGSQIGPCACQGPEASGSMKVQRNWPGRKEGTNTRREATEHKGNKGNSVDRMEDRGHCPGFCPSKVLIVL